MSWWWDTKMSCFCGLRRIITNMSRYNSWYVWFLDFSFQISEVLIVWFILIQCWLTSRFTTEALHGDCVPLSIRVFVRSMAFHMLPVLPGPSQLSWNLFGFYVPCVWSLAHRWSSVERGPGVRGCWVQIGPASYFLSHWTTPLSTILH